MKKPGILIVEDEPITARVISTVLSQAGYVVLDIISYGETAIEKTEEHQPDLVIMDITLNGTMDGIAAASIINERFNIPVIYLTASTDTKTLNRISKTGPYGYVPKPVDRNVLKYTIEIALFKHRTDLMLKESEERYRAVFQNTGTATFIINSDMTISMANSQGEELTGYSRVELESGLKWYELSSDSDRERIREYHNNRMKGIDAPTEYEFMLMDKAGNTRDIFIKIAMIGGTDKCIASCTDMTSRKRTEIALQKSEEKFRTIIDNSSEMIFIINGEGTIIYISKAASRITGFPHNTLINHSFPEFVHPDDRGYVIDAMKIVKNDPNQHPITEFRYHHREDKWLIVEAQSSNMMDNPLVGGIVMNIRDVTARRNAEERAAFYRFYDPLTELPNREKFLSQLQIEITKSERRKKMLAVMCIGLDRFKDINEMYGTSAGDEMLRVISIILKERYREDDLVSRFTGDQFLVLLSDISSSDDVVEIVNKTFDIFSEPFMINNAPIKTSSSIGVSLYPNDGTERDSLIKNAETAMYMAKNQGRNTYTLYDYTLHNEMLHKIKMEQELHDAISNKEFIVYYQPKYDTEGNLSGMESLVRWDSPEHGIVPPGMFIPLAETSSLIIDLGYIVLRQTCEQNRKWQKDGYPPLRVSVNLSPSQFREQNLISNIKSIISETGLEPRWLELEITETGIMENEADSVKKLTELNKMGIAISIDDFGTGYSSFGKLKLYPIDTLKIDKSFIDDLPDDETSANIASTIIDLAHNLGFKVVAEGVENRDQIDFLIAKGCDFFQGYYFSRPVTPDNFTGLLKRLSS